MTLRMREEEIRREAKEEGIQEGLEDGIRKLVATLKEIGIPPQTILLKI